MSHFGVVVAESSLFDKEVEKWDGHFIAENGGQVFQRLRYREPRLPWICTIKGELIDYTLIIVFSIAILDGVESAQIGQTLGLKASPERKVSFPCTRRFDALPSRNKGVRGHG